MRDFLDNVSALFLLYNVAKTSRFMFVAVLLPVKEDLQIYIILFLKLTFTVRRGGLKLLNQQLFTEVFHEIFTNTSDNKQCIIGLPGEYIAGKGKTKI